MTLERANKQSLMYNAKLWFTILLALVWGKNTIFNYVIVVISKLPLIGFVSEIIFPLCITLCVVLALPYLKDKLKLQDFLIYFIMVAILLSTFVFHPENSEYLQEEYMDIISFMLFFFVGVCFDLEDNKNLLFWLSIIGLVLTFLYQAYFLGSGRKMEQDNMNTAYNILPSILYLIYYAFMNKKFRFWLIAIIGIMLEFRQGTRGPILCIIIFLGVGIIYSIAKTENILRKLFGIILVGLAVIALVFTDVLLNAAIALSDSFKEAGYSTRIFDYFIEGMIDDDSGREFIQNKIISAIETSPAFGYGVFGDRLFIGGSYPHNLLLEIFCQFGIVVGGALLITLLFVFIDAIRKSNGFFERLFVFMLIIMVIVKLMLSSSYLYETWLFFLIGVCLQIMRRKRMGRSGL